MNPLIKTAMKIAAKPSAEFLQALETRTDILKRIGMARAGEKGANVIKNLEKAYELITRKMHTIK